MKKLMSIFMIMAMAMFVFVSCEKDNFDNPQEEGEMVTINVKTSMNVGGVDFGGTKSATDLGSIVPVIDVTGGHVYVLLDAATDQVVAKDTVYYTSLSDTVTLSFTAPSNMAYTLFGMDLWAYHALDSLSVSDVDKCELASRSDCPSYNNSVNYGGAFRGDMLRHVMKDNEWLFKVKKDVLIDNEDMEDISIELSPMSLSAVVINLDQAPDDIMNMYLKYVFTDLLVDSLLFTRYESGGLISFSGTISETDMEYVYFQSDMTFSFSKFILVVETTTERREIAFSGFGTSMQPNQYLYLNLIDDSGSAVIDRNVGGTLGNVSAVTNAGEHDIIW